EDCPSGSEYNPETKDCDDCLRGFYRNKTDSQQVKCQKCPDQFITVGTKATSVKNCTIRKGNETKSLTTGNLTGQTNPSPEDCPSGSEYNPETKVCDDCLRGYYRNKTDLNQVKCQKCPDQFITVGTKAISKKNCTIKDCPSGSQYNPETKACDDCLRGYYRNKTDPQQVKCQKCPDQFITVGTKATSVKNCTIKDCPSGSQYNPETKDCDDCPRGFYRDKTDQQQVKCQKCPDQLITLNTKATSVKNCTISKEGVGQNSQDEGRNSENIGDNNKPTNKDANKNPNKDANKNPDLSSLVPESEPEGHFMAYFLTAVVLCVAGYVIFHNKQRIVAFIIEGRTGRRSSRRPNKDGYSRVKTDDVMPSLEKSTTSKSYIY
ncbi:laminin-like protein lam-2, partial [Saccostrea cucullata]|uniref:laminin-like protein lam-2 n=1 Tax=Saccostrea cuccullata TaxID=36930 RepID=UPI002ED0E881